mmetsp:Transcript_9971/g.32037  ORF Transcript_9971/g.32037 Transcript_9971/m.32037 type:complete len:129 (+) Transcript_9971:612-998(+)
MKHDEVQAAEANEPSAPRTRHRVEGIAATHRQSFQVVPFLCHVAESAQAELQAAGHALKAGIFAGGPPLTKQRLSGFSATHKQSLSTAKFLCHVSESEQFPGTSSQVGVMETAPLWKAKPALRVNGSS